MLIDVDSCAHDWRKWGDFCKCSKCRKPDSEYLDYIKYSKDSNECKHEWDGKQYDYSTKLEKTNAFGDRYFWVKCKKCGEFYR